MSLETKRHRPLAVTDWELHTRQDKELVKGLGPDQRHHAGHGLDDRLGHLYRLGGNRARGGFARAADWRMAGHRFHDHRRRPELWRACRHDAARRRSICLPARSARTAMGISLRLDPVPGHPDRNHRRGRRGLRQVPRRLLPSISSTNWILHFWKVPPIHIGPDGPRQHGCRHQHPEPGRHPGGRRALGDQYLRREDRRADPEHFHFRQSFRAAGTGFSRRVHRAQRPGASRQLRRNFWRNAGLSAQHAVQVGVGGPIVMVGTLTILAVAQVGSLILRRRLE